MSNVIRLSVPLNPEEYTVERVTTEMTDHSSAWVYMSVHSHGSKELVRCADLVVSAEETLTNLWSDARGFVYLESPSSWWQIRHPLFRVHIKGCADIRLGAGEDEDEGEGGAVRALTADEVRATEPGTVLFGRSERELVVRAIDHPSYLWVHAFRLEDDHSPEGRLITVDTGLPVHALGSMRLTALHDATGYLLK